METKAKSKYTLFEQCDTSDDQTHGIHYVSYNMDVNYPCETMDEYERYNPSSIYRLSSSHYLYQSSQYPQLSPTNCEDPISSKPEIGRIIQFPALEEKTVFKNTESKLVKDDFLTIIQFQNDEHYLYSFKSKYCDHSEPRHSKLSNELYSDILQNRRNTNFNNHIENHNPVAWKEDEMLVTKTSALDHNGSRKTSRQDENSWSYSSYLHLPTRCLGMDLRILSHALLTCFLLVTFLHPVKSRPTSEADQVFTKRQMDVVKYLAQFGYLKGPKREAQNLLDRQELKKAIKALQKAGGIRQTGNPDGRTADLILKPRCGNTDEFINEGRYQNYKFRFNDGNSKTFGNYRYRRSLSRKKRYTLATSSWKNTNLTFQFINYTPDIPQAKTRKIISDALRLWTIDTPLSFTEVRQSEADIMIQFARKYHSDGYPFDGQGVVLAHAFFPGYGKGGDTHFDDDEQWGYNSTESVDLFMVAAHEFGHALGLAHSSDPQALMFPWYLGFENRLRLPKDDYVGITNLYGSGEKDRQIPKGEKSVALIPKSGHSDRNRYYAVTTPKVVDGSGPPDPCSSHIDALTVFRSELFIFIGKWFWRLDSRKMIEKPIELHSLWYGLPEDLERIDAAYERPDGKIVFFSGDKYWVFNANYLQRGFPKEGRPITEFNIPADVKKIDAAFVWGYNTRTYLVSGDMYWKMNEQNTFVEYDYPRDMGTWKDVPVPLDAAFKDWDGKTYFFQGLDYYEFYDMKMKVRHGYPKQFSRYMLDCPKQKKAEHTDGRTDFEVEFSHPALTKPDGSSSPLKDDNEQDSSVNNNNKNNSAISHHMSSFTVIIVAIFYSYGLQIIC